MNKSLAAVVVALFVAVALIQPVYGGQITWSNVPIQHTQEVTSPPIPDEGSSGLGTFIYTFDDATGAAISLSYDITLTGLDLDGLQTPSNPNDNVTRTHFHAAPAGANGGIVHGQIDGNAALRNDPDDLVVNPVTGRITGVWDGTEGNGTTLEAQKNTLLAGGIYWNVHTSDHAGGEIRGQIPEPASLALALLGAAPLWFRRRRA
jgi:hypothetical protein